LDFRLNMRIIKFIGLYTPLWTLFFDFCLIFWIYKLYSFSYPWIGLLINIVKERVLYFNVFEITFFRLLFISFINFELILIILFFLFLTLIFKLLSFYVIIELNRLICIRNFIAWYCISLFRRLALYEWIFLAIIIVVWSYMVRIRIRDLCFFI